MPFPEVGNALSSSSAFYDPVFSASTFNFGAKFIIGGVHYSLPLEEAICR